MKSANRFAVFCLFLLGAISGLCAERFVVTEPGKPDPATSIVVLSGRAGPAESWAEPAAGSGKRVAESSLKKAVSFLREGIFRMTGMELPVQSGSDPSKGIVLMTLADAPPEIKGDESVQHALRSTQKDAYNANEAYFVRSELERVVIVANTEEGLSHGVVALLESVGYEVLGMGVNWIHVPDFRAKPLAFSLQEEGRPGFYVRLLWPTTGQERGVGTLSRVKLSDPADEPVEKSYQRWSVGTRQAGGSMPRVRGGHALGRYHRLVVEAMRDNRLTEGFLTEKVTLGLDAARPAASPENQGAFWINSDSEGTAGFGKFFISDGKEWELRDLRNRTTGTSLDVSSSLTRGVILKEMIRKAEEGFSETPDDNFNFATDPEDGSAEYARIAELSKDANWYPTYLAEENIEFGKYDLHGFHGLDQPLERWDGNSPSDITYGFNNWLLREFDKYVDSLPESQRLTATGKSKKDLIRCNLLSYNYHDVPPNFNLDPRIRIKIAGFPKHRGKGKWANFRTHADMAQAYRILLPREPSIDYQIWSQAYFHDLAAGNITGSPSAATIQREMKAEYDAGFRGFESETDFNFGKYGLRYYLTTKMLWNPQLTAEELEGLRDRWLQRAYGSAWQEMKAYYDFMIPDGSKANSPNSWAKAVRLLDAASQRLSALPESGAQRRVDDVKQFWYFYYLTESGQTKKGSAALEEFVWKGQMSYMTAMYMVTKRFFDNGTNVAKLVRPELREGPAHYSREETAAWWSKVLAFWPLKSLQDFRSATLANGREAREVDLNDLVRVREFGESGEDAQNVIIYNRLPGSLLRKGPARFLTTVGMPDEGVGFKLLWPSTASKGARRNSALQVPYGMSRWDSTTATWEEVVDMTMALQPSVAVTSPDGGQWYMAEVRHRAIRPGVYRMEVGGGDFESVLTSLDYDLASGNADGASGHTYFSPLEVSSATPRKWYFYIPKGTKRLDLETSARGRTSLQLYRGVPGKNWSASRTIDIGKWGTHGIDLEKGEDGALAVLEGSAFPFLYSVPFLFAKTPSALLVPRAIAEADGLTPQ